MHVIFGHAVSNTATLHVCLNCSIWLSCLCIHDGTITGWRPCVGVVLGVLTAGPRSHFGIGTMVHENLTSNYRALYLAISKLQTMCMFVCVLKTCDAHRLWPCCFEYSNFACMFELFDVVITSVNSGWHDCGLVFLCWCSIGCYNCCIQIMLQCGNIGAHKI